MPIPTNIFAVFCAFLLSFSTLNALPASLDSTEATNTLVDPKGPLGTRTATPDPTGLSPVIRAVSQQSTKSNNAASTTAVTPGSPIKSGLTSFGDSFAAGMGTGRTTQDSCRRGEFSYANILASGASKSIVRERLECSGAIVSEVASGPFPENQVDQWEHPQSADIVTLSVGGNDLFFADIVDGCFVRFAGPLSANCLTSISKARGVLDNGSLQRFIETTLVQIINKSTRKDVKVFLTGYPAFFNVDTPHCSNTSLSYWAPGFTSDVECGSVWKGCAKQELRQKVNDLAARANEMLSAAAKQVNAEKGTKVYFIDPNPALDGHRFCEANVKEPDPKRADTWFFLSEWPDNKLDGTLAPVENSDGDTFFNTPEIPPSSEVCVNGTKNLEMILGCNIARLNENPPEKSTLPPGFDLQKINHLKPTTLIKTFHPRTLGQKAYADLIRQAIS